MSDAHKQSGSVSPFWLGCFPTKSDDLCEGACGRTVTHRAAWWYRAKPLVISLCTTCLEHAVTHAHNLHIHQVPQRAIDESAYDVPIGDVMDPFEDDAPAISVRRNRDRDRGGHSFAYARPR